MESRHERSVSSSSLGRTKKIVDYDPDQSIDLSGRVGFSLVSLAIGYPRWGWQPTDPDQLCAT